MSSQIIDFLTTFVRILGELYIFAIIVRVILSWIPSRPTRFHGFINELTEPLLSFMRRIIPPIAMIDLSPIAAYFFVRAVTWILVAGLIYLQPFLQQLIG